MNYCFSQPIDFAAKRPVIRQDLHGSCPNSAELLFVALNEAVNNAFTHGCAEAFGQGVEIEIKTLANEIYLRVSHQGYGAEPAVIRSELSDELEEHGRGLAIIRLCTDHAEYADNGKTLIMRKFINPTEKIG